MGYPKIGRYLTITYVLFVVFFIGKEVFRDQLFSENDALDLLEEQNIILYDEFKLIKNESFSGVGDYYHTFKLEISEKDKMRIINEIRNSENFTTDLDSVDTDLYQGKHDYFEKKIIQNYVLQDDFIREFLSPPPGPDYAPLFRRISIDKDKNIIIFEEIDP